MFKKMADIYGCENIVNAVKLHWSGFVMVWVVANISSFFSIVNAVKLDWSGFVVGCGKYQVTARKYG